MKILFVNQFYTPDMAATAQRLGELAEFLVQRGAEIQVLCSRGAYDRGTGRPTPRCEMLHGVNVRRLAGFSAGKSKGIKRVLDYAAFHLLAGLWVLMFGWRYDVIVTLTTPPLIGVYATVVRVLSLGRVRHVCWAMDLHPDAEFELGMWSRRNPMWRMLEAMNALHFRKADAVVALGERMKQRIVEKRVHHERVSVIPVWHDGRSIQAVSPQTSALRRERGWDDKFVVMYSGNAGLIHTFDAVCRAMLKLRDDERFKFVFAGGGGRAKEVADFARDHGLTSFEQLPYLPQEKMSDLLAAADVHLVTLRDGMSGVAVPCKLYGIMASGRPTVYVGPADSDTAQHIRGAEAGYVLGTTDAAGIVNAFLELADNRALRDRMGDQARKAFERNYERVVGCQKWATLLEAVVPQLEKGTLCLEKKH